MVKGIVFDMDGVLADTEGFYQQGREAFLQEQGLAREEYPDFSGWSDRAVWEFLTGGDSAQLEALLPKYRAYCQAHPVPFSQLVDPQTKGVFTALNARGLKTAIASSSQRAAILTMMEAAGLNGLVDYVISGAECSAFKPDPEIYLKSLDGLGLRPDEVIILEDSPVGIAAARNAGLRVFALHPRHGEHLDQSAAIAILPELRRILEVV